MTPRFAPTRFRRALAGDLGSIESLLALNKLPLAGVRAHLEDFWLAFAGEQLVGVAGLEVHKTTGLLRPLAVDARFRNAGTARELVGRVVADARERKLTSLCMPTETVDDYFERRGFVRSDRALALEAVLASEEFRGACPASATFMQLNDWRLS
jgi:N-acetylglutamate synthase-like GNAT family acetyltransferase